jgi:NAD(P)H-hydrate epimerase
MKLLTAQQIRDWDQYTIQHTPITSVELMERAASLCAGEIISVFQKKQSFNSVVVCCGPGNNGGDGLVVARILFEQGIPVSVCLIGDVDKRSTDFNVQLNRLPSSVQCTHIQSEKDLPVFNQNMMVVDALLGSGINRAPEGLMGLIISSINKTDAFVIAVDLPSGLPSVVYDHDDLTNRPVIKASRTITFQLPKLSFLHAESYPYTGEITILDIGLLPEFMVTVNSPFNWVTKETVQGFYKPRPVFGHKGKFGHALIVGGSYGKLGAALLSSKAALRAGCGLVTGFVPKVGFTVFQTALPEIMVQTDDELYEIRNFPETSAYAAIGVGPGLGTHEYTEKGFATWLEKIHQPIVIDADALNICAVLIKKDRNFRFPANSILTPHPKEFDRLAGQSKNSYEREQKQKHFAAKYGVVVVLKGAYTCTAFPDGELFYNSSGNVALATAGSGDVLTGIITSLLAQQYTPQEATIMGVYLHGVCADLWVEQQRQTMIAGDIIEMIPKALYRIFN